MTDNKIRLTGRNVVALSGVALLFVGAILCFCSLLPFVLFVSFLFNALFLGTSLFATLAQEREKRTIDALRLTQLSSLEILLYKSHHEMKLWRQTNLFLMIAAGATALWAGSPLSWALAGAASLAAGGLLSISLALAVSTRSETTSSAVVSGWITKGVWLAGLPILDYVLEAVFVSRDFHVLSFLDPAWVLHTVVYATLFETSTWSIAPLLAGAAAMALAAKALLHHSSGLIDSSFESAATLEDRERHSAYGKRYAFGLESNPFMVRELAWQIRSGAGAWPGYAVFVTLFLAPFLYGMAQQHRPQDVEPVRVVRQSVTQTSPQEVSRSYFQEDTQSTHLQVATSYAQPTHVRCHSGICLSQLLGLPVPTANRHYYDTQSRIVVTSNGTVTHANEAQIEHMNSRPDPGVRWADYEGSNYYSNQRSALQIELDRGLLTGLVLTILYLFIRGAAFMSGAVTGEHERRSWDQIALTGASPDTYLNGKLFGVLYYPMRQLIFTSPILILFALYGGVSALEMFLVVPLMALSFLAAANIGLLASATEKTSHQSQGKALLAAGALAVAPMMPGGFVLCGLLAMIMLKKSTLDHGERTLAVVATMVWTGLMGASVSPLAGVMNICHYEGLGPLSSLSGLPPAASLLVGIVTMAAVAWVSKAVAIKTMNDGGGVRA